MGVDPEVATILLTVGVVALIGTPGFAAALRRRRAAMRACLDCGRVKLLGERTCDCL